MEDADVAVVGFSAVVLILGIILTAQLERRLRRQRVASR